MVLVEMIELWHDHIYVLGNSDIVVQVAYELYMSYEMHLELINLHPNVSAPARGQGTVLHVMFTSHTLRLPWIQGRCTCLSYRQL